MHKVLIVEDNQTMNDKLKGLVLGVEGTEVVQAYDRASAEQELRKGGYAVLVADVMLGDKPQDKLSGLSLLRVLGESPTVAIVVSGMPDDLLPDVAYSLAAFDFISKPINDLDFISKIEHALAAHAEEARTSGAEAARRSLPSNLTQDTKRKLNYRWKGKPVLLSLTELRLVQCLLETPNTVVPYAKLSQQLKSSNNNPKAVATHITGVRRRFVDVDEQFDAIDSEPGKGYVWRTTAP